MKNAEGVDSPATCLRDQVRRAARWLKGAGIEVPQKAGGPDAVLEISPLFATSAQQLRQRNVGVSRISPGQAAYFGANGLSGD